MQDLDICIYYKFLTIIAILARIGFNAVPNARSLSPREVELAVSEIFRLKAIMFMRRVEI